MLRAIAIVYVVLGHVTTLPLVENYVWSFHVPLFFFVSGILFKDKQEGFWKYLKDRFFSLMVPYYSIGLVCVLIFALLGRFAAEKLAVDGYSFDILTNLGGLLYGSAKTGHLKFNLPLWFLPCLFCVTVIYYFINRLTQGKPGRIMMAMVLFAVGGYVINYHTGIRMLPLGLETAITMTVFYGAGNLYQVRGLKDFDRPFWILLILAGAVISCFNGRVTYSADRYNNILLFYPAVLCSIIGYTALARTIDHSSILEYLGRNTLPVFALHKLPVLFFQTVVPFTARLLKANNMIVILGVSLAGILLSLLAGEIIRRIAPWAIGERKRV